MIEPARTGAALRVGLIGFGAIGQAVAEALATGEAGRATLTAVLCRNPARHRAAIERLAMVQPFMTSSRLSAFLEAKPALVIEAAGHEALRLHGRPVLESGADLLVTSIGALADDGFRKALEGTAMSVGRRLLLAGGALPAVDWMRAASLAGDCDAAITQTKPVASWRGTPAEELVALDGLQAPACFFEGSAREAARRFPNSSNITAMLALTGAGLDATRVRLVADPVSSGMHTRVEFRSAAGVLRYEWEGVPSARNPRTSADVPLSVIQALRNLTEPLVFAP